MSPVGAILISVTMVLIFGEIVPQAFCQRFGLAVGSRLRFLVWPLLVVALPVSAPLAYALDRLLGKEDGGLFRRAQLKALVDIHGSRERGGHGGELTADETMIISGALDLSHKTVASVMTPLARVVGCAVDTPLTWASLRQLLASGHSRLPVHAPGEPGSIRGLLLVKELFAGVRPQDLGLGELGSPPPPPRTLEQVVPVRPLPRMNAATPLYTALNYFQTGRSHMALVTTGQTVLFLGSEPEALGVPVDRESGEWARGPPGAARSFGRTSVNPASGVTALSVVAASKAVASPLPASPSAVAAEVRRLGEGTPAGPGAQPSPLIMGSAAAVRWDGEVLGILTLEDVLEELLQEEILDEADRDDPQHEAAAAAANDVSLTEHLSSPAPPRQSGRGSEGPADSPLAGQELARVTFHK